MQIIKKFSLFVVCLMLVFSASLMFVGCGKNDNKIRLNEVTHSIFYAPLYVALNMGFFEEEGLEVTLESTSGSDSSMTTLISGSADIILAGPEQVVYAEEVKDRPMVFGQLTQKDGSFIVGREDTDNFSLNDLKGKTIIGGRQGGLPAMTLQYVIETSGLKIGTNAGQGEVNLRTDVAFANIGSEFITSGNEYCTLFEPTATLLEKAGNGFVLKAVGDLSGYIPYTCFIAKESYLRDKSEQSEKFLKAVYKGYKYISTESAEKSAKALKNSFAGMTQEELEIAVTQYLAIDAWCSSPVMSEASFDKLLAVLNNASKDNYNPSYSKLVNTSIAQKIGK